MGRGHTEIFGASDRQNKDFGISAILRFADCCSPRNPQTLAATPCLTASKPSSIRAACAIRPARTNAFMMENNVSFSKQCWRFAIEKKIRWCTPQSAAIYGANQNFRRVVRNEARGNRRFSHLCINAAAAICPA